MTTPITTRDPVQGLVDYVLDIKPFHTKILEVWVEYIYNDPINATVKDELDWEIYIDFDQLPGCRYGWDTTPWDMFWNIKDVSEIAVGTISYKDGAATKTIDRFAAYQLFFAYLTALWLFRAGHGNIEPTQGDISPQNPFRVLWLPLATGTALVVSECANYWTTTVLSNQFWFDPQIKRLYRHIGNEWVEQPFYYTSVEPTAAVIGEYWFCVGVDKLYTRPVDGTTGWVEIKTFYTSYDVPDAAPTYPEPWKSNWDYPPCPSASGEHLVYTRVTDLLSFDHGSEIFLFDAIRTAVLDPKGHNVDLQEYLARVSSQDPVRYRTTVVQTSRNHYKLEREEISSTSSQIPNDSGNTKWTISLNDFAADGWDLMHPRKDVKLGEFLTWKHTTGGMKLIRDNLSNRQTFMLRRSNGTLTAQTVNGVSVVDTACPWNTGTVVYLRTTDDLPGYQDPITLKTVRFERYRPYSIYKLAGNTFSLVLLDRATLAVDTTAMNGLQYLAITASPAGRNYIGIGYPVPFMEVRQKLTEAVQLNKTKETLASPMEIFTGFIPSVITDIAIAYPGPNGSYTGFVVEGNFSGHKQGSEIQVGGSPSKVNDGMWTVDKVAVYTNAYTSFSPSGVGVPSATPSWWNATALGPWPLPVKKRQSEIDALIVAGEYSGFGDEYNYATFSLIAVSDGIPTVTTRPNGFVAEPNYNFNEGTGPNSARTTVADKLIFGSLKATLQPDGTTTFAIEQGVPGVSIVLNERIQAIIQEGLNRNDPYGGQTIGSYDSPFFDQDTYDENLDTVIQRLGSQ